MIEARIHPPAGWRMRADDGDPEAVDAVGAGLHGIRVAAWRSLRPDPAGPIGDAVAIAASVVEAPSAASIVAWCRDLVQQRGAHRADPSARILRWSATIDARASIWSLVAPDDRTSTRALLVLGTIALPGLEPAAVRTSVAAICATADAARILR